MNILRRFMGSGAKEKQVSLAPGELHLIRGAHSPKGHQETIFTQAEVSLIENSGDLQCQVVVRPINDDDPDTDDDGLEGLDAERWFLADAALQMGYFARNGRTIVTWKDLDGDTGDRYEFVCDPAVSAEALRVFDQACRTAQFTRKYGKEPKDDADLAEFDFDDIILASMKSKEEQSAVDVPVMAGAGAVAAPSQEQAADAFHPITDGRVIVKAPVVLCLYDAAQSVFVVQFEGVDACLLDLGAYDRWLEVRKGNSAILGVNIAEDLNPFVDEEKLAFIFNFMTPSGHAVTYLLRFSTQGDLNRFELEYAQANWEATNRSKWSDVAEPDQDYVVGALGKLSLEAPAHDDQEQYSENENDNDNDNESADEAEDDNGDEFAKMTEFTGGKQRTAFTDRNSALEVGHVNDRTYVVRGNKIGVFKNVEDLEYSTTISSVSRPDGSLFSPDKMMLHEQDRALLLQDKDNLDKIYRMDLEYGQIVDEWGTERDLRAFAPVNKDAQTTGETNVLGLSKQQIFRIDPRLAGSKVVDGSVSALKTKAGFSSITTTQDGYFAVGSETGDIRLYNKLGIRAKTLIPGLGNNVIGLDVTSDGGWLLATCKTYLLLLETRSTEYNSFTKGSMAQKPRPRRLQISPENAAFMYAETGQPLSFTPARFDTGPDAKEQSIVTSSGPYVITWNLKAILRGDKNSYLIKRYNSIVTADNFKYGSDKRVIVAFEDDVGMVAKSALRRPTRQSLAGRR